MRSGRKAYLRSLYLLNGVRAVTVLWAALLAVIALTGSPGTPNLAMGIPLASGTDTQAWTVAQGDSAAWKILPNRLECTVAQPGPHWIVSKSPLQGDFVIEASLGPAFAKGEGLIFSASSDLSYGYLLTIGVSTSLYKFSGSDFKLIKTWPLGYGRATGVHLQVLFGSVRIVKKGTTYRIELGGQVLNTVSNPGGAPTAKQHQEPDGGHWGFAFSVEGRHTVSDMRALGIPSAEFFPNNPIVSIGPKGAWDQSVEAFPVGVLRHENKFYLYYVADYEPYPPGVGLEPPRRVGIAISSDLRAWEKYEKNPVFGPPLEGDTVRFFDFPPSTKYATMHGGGGVVRLPNGNYGLTFNVQRDHEWLGVWLAEATSPLGPFQFQKVKPGPILTLGGPGDFDGKTIHLQGALQLSDGTYAMLYTGHNPKFETAKPPGDRGGLATSKDMIYWTKFAGNPIFEPGEPGSWDDRHVRPRTLARLGDWYYMFYEGAHQNDGGWPPWADQVGMARSQDLIHWERYPYNPIISTTTSKQSGDVGLIQPSAFVSDDTLYVFYGCIRSGSPSPVAVCGARIPAQILEKWGAP